MTIPLLILGDSPSAQTGLGRICRDLSTRIAANLSDVFDVATLGYGGFGDSSLPFFQYHIEGMENWFIPTLRDVWEDFAQDRQGVILTIWDASRLLWFSRPDNPGWCPDPKLREWLQHPPFKRWGYFPMDATGPNNQLSVMLKECMLGYDRVLAYSKWAEGIIRRSVDANTADRMGLTTLPHGIDTEIFHPRRVNRSIFKSHLGFKGPDFRDDEKLIGIVATNQARKDYGLAMETLAILGKDVPLRVYIQTDNLERYWSIPALLMDYGLMSRAIVNLLPISDDSMADIYSACDATLGIGSGEGFGYPIFESLACGTPVLTGSYGGQAEWMHGSHANTLGDPSLPAYSVIDPKSFRLEGLYNCVRPVFDAKLLAYYLRKILNCHRSRKSLLPHGLDWNILWPEWESWFKSGQTRRPEGNSPDSTNSSNETDREQGGRRMLKAVFREPVEVVEAAPIVDDTGLEF